MEHYFIQRRRLPRAVLFFAGWGMDWRPFADCRPPGSDLLVCYDYRSLAFDPSWVAGYERIRVAAWSMGVWAASQVLPSAGLPAGGRIAVNGTPVPVHDETGISHRIYAATADALNERSYRKFLRRMCGGAEALDAFLLHRPLRPLDELKEELLLIGERSAALPPSDFAWTRAFIGRQDSIFLPPNQRRAWAGRATPVIEADVPHYSAELLRTVIEGGGDDDD